MTPTEKVDEEILEWTPNSGVDPKNYFGLNMMFHIFISSRASRRVAPRNVSSSISNQRKGVESYLLWSFPIKDYRVQRCEKT
jgi:hypothetical protein